MQYTKKNLATSMALNVSEGLRALGYDIYWAKSGVSDMQTAGLAESLGRVTLTDAFPAKASNIVRLNNGSPSEDQLPIPVFVVSVGDRRTLKIAGLGHREYERMREVRLDGFATDEFEQEALAAILEDMFEYGTTFVVYDFETNEISPPLLPKVVVEKAQIELVELEHEVEAVRYNIKLTALVSYEE